MADGAYAQTAKNTRAIAIGPWEIEASFTKNRKFDRCVMRRTIEEGIETQFTRGAGGLSLMMSSPRWRLEKGEKVSGRVLCGFLGLEGEGFCIQ